MEPPGLLPAPGALPACPPKVADSTAFDHPGAGAEQTLRELVDWPVASRDGYVLSDAANAVVNAYAVGGLRALSQPVETAAFVVAQLATPSSHGGKRWLGAAPHTQEEPLSH